MLRRHKIASLVLFVLALLLLIHDFWPKNEPSQAPPPVAEASPVKFDFYTILPSRNLKRAEIAPNSN